jgi:RNA polymerase sigma factor (TIGR02999 family)
MGDLTVLCQQIAAGNQAAKDELVTCVYEELYRMAERHLRKNQQAGRTLGPTGLVHEVFLRINGPALEKNRAYLFGAAAIAMDRILKEHRRKRRLQYVDLDHLLDELASSQQTTATDLYAALEELRQLGGCGERRYQVVIQRYFLGLKWKEIADSHGVAVRTAEQDWQFARAWLYKRLNK